LVEPAAPDADWSGAAEACGLGAGAEGPPPVEGPPGDLQLGADLALPTQPPDQSRPGITTWASEVLVTDILTRVPVIRRIAMTIDGNLGMLRRRCAAPGPALPAPTLRPWRPRSARPRRTTAWPLIQLADRSGALLEASRIIA